MKRSKGAWLFATWFGCGYLSAAPGTVASFAAIAIAWPLSLAGFRNIHFVILSLAVLYPGIRAADIVAAESAQKDPRFIVVDEVLGQWLTFAGALRFNWAAFALGLVFFRVFDIWKPPPIRLIERMPGGTGIVLDDMMAGVYAALVLFTMGWFNLY